MTGSILFPLRIAGIGGISLSCPARFRLDYYGRFYDAGKSAACRKPDFQSAAVGSALAQRAFSGLHTRVHIGCFYGIDAADGRADSRHDYSPMMEIFSRRRETLAAASSRTGLLDRGADIYLEDTGI